MKVTIIDCFDSFTYNLYQLVGTIGAEPTTITCNKSLNEVIATDPDRIILSPGPGTPEDSGICAEVIRKFSGSIPILGVCLGHQTIVHTYGGKIIRLAVPVHGKTSIIEHDGTGLFEGLKTPFEATRYHSLTADPESLPKELKITAKATDDKCIMAVTHEKEALFGVQFHPESVMSLTGNAIMKNFLRRNL